MDAFSVIKTYIPDKDDSLVNTIIKSMTGIPQQVYMPASFKAVIDLEIDALVESGGMLQKCPRCGEYFLKDSEYPHDYCSRRQKDGVTCLEAMGAAADEQISAAVLFLDQRTEKQDKREVGNIMIKVGMTQNVREKAQIGHRIKERASVDHKDMLCCPALCDVAEYQRHERECSKGERDG